MGVFLQSSLKSRPLPEETVRQLCARARAGSQSARDQLLRAHLRLVVHVAGHFYRPGCFCELGDLVQQGCLGLLHAVTKFNPKTYSRGKRVRFATYAHFWVSHCIRREIENNGRTISIPIKRLREAREDSSYPVAAVSLDQEEWLEDDIGSALARLVDINDASDNWCQAWEARQEVEQLLKTLPPREKEILKCRFGLDGDAEPLTQRQTGRRLGVSAGLIGLLERATLSQLQDQARRLL